MAWPVVVVRESTSHGGHKGIDIFVSDGVASLVSLYRHLVAWVLSYPPVALATNSPLKLCYPHDIHPWSVPLCLPPLLPSWHPHASEQPHPVFSVLLISTPLLRRVEDFVGREKFLLGGRSQTISC